MERGPSPGEPFLPLRAVTRDGSADIVITRGGRLELAPLRTSRLDSFMLSGRVLTAGGNPAADRQIQTLMVRDDGTLVPTAFGRTDRDGRFSIRAFSSVRYRVAVGEWRSPDAVADVIDAAQPIVLTVAR